MSKELSLILTDYGCFAEFETGVEGFGARF